MTRQPGASVTGDVLEVRASALYHRGEPCGPLDFKLVSNMGTFKFIVIADDDAVFVDTLWTPPLATEHAVHEYVNPIEWVPWRFNSKRPYLICARCGARAIRGFLTTYEPYGALFCHRHAHIRYRSQDRQPKVDRIAARIDSIRMSLGEEPTRGDTRKSLPSKPPRMHWNTYEQHLLELHQLEEALAAAKKERLEKAAARSRRK